MNSSIRAGHVTAGTEVRIAGTWETITSTVARRTGIILITSGGTRIPASLYTEFETR